MRVNSEWVHSMKIGQQLTLGIWKGMWNASQFLDLYLGELKGNGVQSYRRVFPRAKYQSAKASASRLLWKPGIQQMLKRKMENVEVSKVNVNPNP